MKVAVVKPDHLGDFALSLPAISAIANRYSDTTLFVATSTRPLAAHTCPGIPIHNLDLPHLSKFGARIGLNSEPINLNAFDFVYFLRRDQVFNPAWTELMAHRSVLVEDRHDVHETKLQAQAVWQSGLRYELPDSHRPGIAFPPSPKRAGLCISAGFYANRWPTLRWFDLGRELLAHGVALSIVCGPFEKEEGSLLARMLGLDPGSRLIVGTADFGGFLERVRNLDFVIANDGGTAHICSLAVPVVSLFGGSPYRRYAPYGKHNRLVTRLLGCSPCCQYHESTVNGCVTIECLSGMSAKTVLQAVFEPPRDSGDSKQLDGGCTLFFGLSHAS